VKLSISYEDAQKQYPTEVTACVASVRKGKSKDKDTDPSTWEWFFSWAESIEAMSFGSLLALRPKPAPNPTPEEQLQAVLPKILGLCLESVPPNKRTRGVAALAKGFVPAEVQAYLLDIYRQEAAEKARVAALTPEQRDEEMQAALAELRKGRGFMELRIK